MSIPPEQLDSDRLLSPGTRLAAWIVTIAVALLAPAWVILGAPAGPTVAAVHGFAAMGVLLALLRTTPPDAIKLRWPTSATLIALGALALPLAAGLSTDPLHTTGLRGAIYAVFGSLLLLALLLPPNSGVSPWWAAIPLWAPSLWLLELPGVASGGLSILGTIARVLTLVIIFAAVNGRPVRELAALLAMAATLTVAALHF